MWNINQYIVCIKTPKSGVVKEGLVYTIKGLKYFCCNTVTIDVGLYGGFAIEACRKCGDVKKATDDKYWLSESLFKPLDELSDISELLEVLNKENYQEV